ncbi:hypothetical protein CC79DRAFT_1316367 [Sarocladium strictum]
MTVSEPNSEASPAPQCSTVSSSPVAQPAPVRIQQAIDPAGSNVQHMNEDITSSSTAVNSSTEHGASGGEQGVFTIARIQAQNKVYMVMPNFTDVGIAGMHYLNSELHRFREEVAVVGEGSPRFQQLMEDMIDKKIKLDKLRKGLHDAKKLPQPFVSDINKICRQTRRALPDGEPGGTIGDALYRHDRGDWARLSVMAPTEYFVARLPHFKIGSWICVPARLRPVKGSGVEAYSPLIRQFFSILAEILFLIFGWVFASVPVIVKSLENPNKKIEVLFYSLFFIFWSIVTSLLTPNFEVRLYLNVGMAAFTRDGALGTRAAAYMHNTPAAPSRAKWLASCLAKSMSGSNEPQSAGGVRKASVRIFVSTPNAVV